jgi:HK97 family phage major capsid protein
MKLNEPMTELDFQNTVLGGLEAAQKEIATLKSLTPAEQIIADQSRWPKEIKAGMEDLTKLKNTANGLDSEVKAITKSLASLDALTRREARLSFGDPVERFLSDPEKRNFFNGLARRLAFPNAKLPEHLEKALTGVDSSLGSALIPTEYMTEMYSVLAEYGDYNTLNVMRVGARTNSLPLISARPAAAWYGAGAAATEGTAIAAADYTGSAVTLAIQTLGVILYASREQLADSTIDMSSVIVRDLAMSVAQLLDETAFNGDGTADATDAGQYGIFQLVASVHTGLASTATGHTTVATTTLADWEKCLTTVSVGVLKRACKWWMHPQIRAKVALIVDSNGRPIFQTALETPSSTIGSIFGYPVVPVTAAPSTDSTGAKVAVFGDPMSQVVGIRSDIELAQSEHIKFAENQIGFRTIMRAGIKTRVPTGNPAGFKPLTVLTLG